MEAIGAHFGFTRQRVQQILGSRESYKPHLSKLAPPRVRKCGCGAAAKMLGARCANCSHKRHLAMQRLRYATRPEVRMKVKAANARWRASHPEAASAIQKRAAAKYHAKQKARKEAA
jgi:hypothetical protein